MKRFFLLYLPTIFWLIVIFSLPSFFNSNDFRNLPFQLDKLAHFFEFGILGLLFVRAIYISNNKKDLYRAVLITIGITFLLSGIDEFRQVYMSNRSASFLDFTSDILGVVCFQFLYLLFRKRIVHRMKWIDRIFSNIFSYRINKHFRDSIFIKEKNSFYEESADIYVSCFSDKKTDDIPMYISYAEMKGSPILEAACGDGRIILPLAEKGYKVFGMDTSKEMIRRCTDNIAKSADGITPDVQICRASMTDVPFRSVFKLVLIPYNSFNHLITEAQQRSAMRSIFRSMDDNGLLVMEVLPYHKCYFQGFRPRSGRLFMNEEKQLNVVSKVKHDKENKTHTVYWYIEEKTDRGIDKKIITSFTRRDIPTEEICRMLVETGFKIIDKQNYYQKQKKKGDKRIITALKP
ncbi:VanZ family protein [candidate division KSB1 bacterium]